jgi:hypothetical protein
MNRPAPLATAGALAHANWERTRRRTYHNHHTRTPEIAKAAAILGPERCPGVLYPMVVDTYDRWWLKSQHWEWQGGGVFVGSGGLVRAGPDQCGLEYPGRLGHRRP